MDPRSARDCAIERALAVAARRLEHAAGGGWRLVVANGTLTTLRARVIDEDWLVVTAPCVTDGASVTAGASWWSLLQLNARLDGCARIARTQRGDLEARAEIFVDGDAGAEESRDASLVERVAALCDDVVFSVHGAFDALPGAEANTTPASPSDPDQLARLCSDAGWNATARASGEVQVSLDTRTAAFQAALGLDADSRLRAVVPLSTSAMAPGVSRDAIALLLLHAGAHVRTVKGVALQQGDVERAGIAIAGERLPASPATLDRALAALTVACDIVGREVQALQDEALARDYLALHHSHAIDSRSRLSHSHELEDTPCLQLP